MEKLGRNIRSLILSEMTVDIQMCLFPEGGVPELGGGGGDVGTTEKSPITNPDQTS